MDLDRSDTVNKFFYSDGSALKSYNLITRTDTTIAGSSSTNSYLEGIGSDAEFNRITSFTRLNSTHLLVVDSANHCIRLVHRLTKHTSSFAGGCGKHGFKNGALHLAMFNTPYSIISNGIEYGDNNFYVTDTNNNILREVSSTGHVLTYAIFNDRPYGITTETVLQKTFFVALPTQVAVINRDHPDSVTYLLQTTVSGFRDGSFSSAQFGQLRGDRKSVV